MWEKTQERVVGEFLDFEMEWRRDTETGKVKSFGSQLLNMRM